MSKRPSPNEVICIDSSDDDDDDDDEVIVVVQQKQPLALAPRKKIKSERSPVRAVDNRNPDNTEAVEIVEAMAPTIVPASARKGSTGTTAENDDDDIEVMGATNVQRLPHSRQHCPDHKFDAQTPLWDDIYFYKRETITTNAQCCDLCYCYACDCPAKDCISWMIAGGTVSTNTTSNSLHSNHCCAAETLPIWRCRRQFAVRARQQEEAAVAGRSTATPATGRNFARRSLSIVNAERAAAEEAARANAASALSFAATDTKVGGNHSHRKTPVIPRVVNPLLSSGEYHLREHCPKHKFRGGTPTPGHKANNFVLKFVDIAENQDRCMLCFCYVCDKPAHQCKRELWRKPGVKSMSGNHCCAIQTEKLWRNMRAKRNPPETPLTIEKGEVKHEELDGPFAPDNEAAANDASLTKCRKCTWYSRLANNPGKPSSFDWCHKCGRVASEKDFGKLQAHPGMPSTTDIFLGEKIIPFRLQAHDPRELEGFQESWQTQGSEWDYDEAEMEEDLFLHRFGDRPTISMIMASIPILDKVPKTSSCNTINAAVDSEAMILEQHNHKALLQLFQNTGTCDNVGTPIFKGNLCATFEKETRRGALTIRLFLPQNAFQKSACKTGEDSYSNILGNWFDIYPFSLSQLSGPLKVNDFDAAGGSNLCQRIPCPPFMLAVKERRLKAQESRSTRKKAMADHNEAAENFRSSLSLVSGSGSKIMGGVSTNDSSLKGCLQRYCSENLAQEVVSAVSTCMEDPGIYRPRDASYPVELEEDMRSYSESLWVEREVGVVSHHRKMANRELPAGNLRRSGHLKRLELFLTHDDAVLAASNCREDLFEIYNNTGSMHGMLEHLENIGHKSAAYVEGLKIELLQFQREALQWSLDRELCPGGVQTYWWAKLPHANGFNEDIYFNPVLQSFRRGRPATIRGGFIASEMGLGKTIISLGLILCNPAPTSPQSGSNVKRLFADAVVKPEPTNVLGWDKTLYAKTADTCSKRGSILSRATLVVCPVSLVGQWIEEAKSKLKDPGLVYPYHGQDRTRSPLVLAQNAIVVTTYAVIASDATYHAKKAKCAGYVPPLEQVRWWRVICDEGHSLKDKNTNRSNALMRLVADHKWLVSGTPVASSFIDLTNQLRFLGIDNLVEMMEKFRGSAFLHAAEKQSHYGRPLFGNLLFFLRSIMLRHRQNMTYRGTSTTLMSLPPKTERILHVDFSVDERQHYATLEESARSYYVGLKTAGQVSRNYLALTQKLNQTRIASAGGKYPLEKQKTEDDTGPTAKTEDGNSKSDHNKDFWEDDQKESKKAPNVAIYSDFVFKSKLNTLIKELEVIRDEDPSAKSLVFSQYTSTLEWLQQELPLRGFQFRTLNGKMSMKQRAKALIDFQADPPTTIFLLSMRAGAVGINLTQANRIFLMEPSFNTALEAQAIGRVHRLGQKRSTQVTRLVMSDSIETRILQAREKRNGDENQENQDDDKHATAKSIALVGSVQSDRLRDTEKEFDVLFGATTNQPDNMMSCSSDNKVGLI